MYGIKSVILQEKVSPIIKYMDMEKIITSKVRQNLDEQTARIILERSDKLAQGTLDQLRKSTDRSYTMVGFLITIFVALTAFVFSKPSLWQLSVTLVLWMGTGIGLYILFSKVLWVHRFSYVGDDPRNMISEKNIDVLSSKYDYRKFNERYSLNTLLDAINNNQKTIDRNEEILNSRCDEIEKAMTVIKVTIMIASLITVISLFTSSVASWW